MSIDDDIDWYALSNGLGTVMPDGTRILSVDEEAEMAEAKAEESGPAFLERVGTDGMKWAEEFNATAIRLGLQPMDVGWLVGWFANAIEAGAMRERSNRDTLDMGSDDLSDSDEN